LKNSQVLAIISLPFLFGCPTQKSSLPQFLATQGKLQHETLIFKQNFISFTKTPSFRVVIGPKRANLQKFLLLTKFSFFSNFHPYSGMKL
jgi:hypothetical protein